MRLYQGDYSRETVFSEDPVAVALDWQRQGAQRLHLVDLDGAASGKPVNIGVITAIIRALDIPIQVGGGIRCEETAETWLTSGVDRVVLGTAAVQNQPLVGSLCSNYGAERVVVALDARDGMVAIKGWEENTSVTALGLAHQLKAIGLARVLYTDISRDGTLTSPNFSANEELVRETELAVLASGGIASVGHIRELLPTGVEGAILGRALYTGAVSLPEAIAAAGG